MKREFSNVVTPIDSPNSTLRHNLFACKGPYPFISVWRPLTLSGIKCDVQLHMYTIHSYQSYNNTHAFYTPHRHCFRKDPVYFARKIIMKRFQCWSTIIAIKELFSQAWPLLFKQFSSKAKTANRPTKVQDQCSDEICFESEYNTVTIVTIRIEVRNSENSIII